MKGIASFVTAAALMLGLGLCSCKKASPLKTVYITRSTIKKIATNKASRPDTLKKVSSAVLELFEQLRQNQAVDSNAGFDLPPALEAKADLIVPSLAKASGDSVLCYFHSSKENDTSFDSLIDNLSFLGIGGSIKGGQRATLGTDSHGGYTERWLRKDKYGSALSVKQLMYLSLITDPIRSSDPTPEAWIARSPKVLSVPNFPIKEGELETVGIISDDCGMSEGLLASNPYLNGSPSNCPFSGTDNSQDRTHEGLAMMEVVQHIAPRVITKFSTATGSANSTIGVGGLAEYRRNLIQMSGDKDSACQIICDDVLYPEEAMFEQGTIAYVMDSLAQRNGTVFISAAGNMATSLFNFTFTPSPSPVPLGKGDTWLTETVDQDAAKHYPFEININQGSGIDITLQWDDPYDSSYNDFDMYLVDKATKDIVAFSNNFQLGDGYHPYERLAFPYSPCWGSKGYQLYITRYAANTDTIGNPKRQNPMPRMKLLLRGNITGKGGAKSNSIFGHAADQSVIACGAMDVNSPWQTERFSSQGDYEIVNVRAQIDPLTMHRPKIGTLSKPDICALDGIATSVPGFPVFNGTSAAAPVAAGIASLILSNSATHKLTPADLKIFLQTLQNACILYAAAATTGNRDIAQGYGRADAFQGIALWLTQKDPNYFAQFQDARTPITIPQGTSSGKNHAFISVTFDNPGGPVPCSLSVVHSGITYSLHNTSAPLNPSVIFSKEASSAWADNKSYGCYLPDNPTTFPPASAFDGDWTISTVPPGIVRKWGVIVKQ